MLRTRTICGRIGLLFLVPPDGPSLIVSHCGTKDTGSLPAVTKVGAQSLCTRKAHVVDLLLAAIVFGRIVRVKLTRKKKSTDEVVDVKGSWSFYVARLSNVIIKYPVD
jgi:hypothetical protein